MYRLHYALMAVIRYLAVRVLPVREGMYQYPENVGYASWIEWRGYCLAFRRNDGSVQYYW